MVAYTCNSNTGELRQGHREFQARLGYIEKACLKRRKGGRKKEEGGEIVLKYSRREVWKFLQKRDGSIWHVASSVNMRTQVLLAWPWVTYAGKGKQRIM